MVALPFPRVAVLIAGVVLMVSVALLGCAPAQPSGDASKQMTILVGVGPTNLDPHQSISSQALTFWVSMFDSLTRFDEKMQIQPALATSWKPINDTTWEFKLRSGVKFHNGEPFNAEAVKVSLGRIVDPATKAVNQSRMPLLQKVEVVDDLTVRLITKSPSPTLPHGLIWGWIVPPKYLKERGDPYFAQNPVGTGPFKFVDWVQGQYINLAANTEYWGGRPKLDKLAIKTSPDPSVQVASIKAGEAQLITDVPTQVVKEIQNTQGVKVLSKLYGAVTEINLYSKQGGPLANKTVRQALNHAIDKQAILDRILEGHGAIAQGQVVSPEAFGFDPDSKPYPYDPAKAKALLAEAGFDNGFKMPMTTSFGRYVMDKEIAIALTDQLGKVGVQVEINNLEWGIFQDLRRKERTPNYFTAWLNYGDARFALQHATSKSTFPYWSNAEFDRLFDLSERTVDVKEREKILRDAIKLMREEAPVIFLFQTDLLYGVSERVTGWEPHFTGWIYTHKMDLK